LSATSKIAEIWVKTGTSLNIFSKIFLENDVLSYSPNNIIPDAVSQLNHFRGNNEFILFFMLLAA
jgi:hypothetical protein